MSSDSVPLHAYVDLRHLFEDEFWWTVTRVDGSLFDFGWDTDLKAAGQRAKEAARRLSRELGYL